MKSSLVFNKQNGKLVGFVNLGSLNSDLDAMEKSLNNETGLIRSSASEKHASPHGTTSFEAFCTFPVAQYVEHLILYQELNKFQVFYVSCDGHSASQDVDDAISIICPNFLGNLA